MFAMISAVSPDRSILKKSIAANSAWVKPEQFGLSGLPQPLPFSAVRERHHTTFP